LQAGWRDDVADGGDDKAVGLDEEGGLLRVRGLLEQGDGDVA